MTTNVQSRQSNDSRRGLWLTALVAGVAAALVNLLVYLLATTVFGLPLEIATPRGPTMPLTPMPIIITSFVPAIGAAVLLALLNRFVRRPFPIFLAVAVVFLLLSLGAPLSLPVAATTKAILILMHVLAGAAIVGILARLAR